MHGGVSKVHVFENSDNNLPPFNVSGSRRLGRVNRANGLVNRTVEKLNPCDPQSIYVLDQNKRKCVPPKSKFNYNTLVLLVCIFHGHVMNMVHTWLLGNSFINCRNCFSFFFLFFSFSFFFSVTTINKSKSFFFKES